MEKELDALITERLAVRQHMMLRMEEMEGRNREKRAQRKAIWTVVAMAAVLTAVVWMSPMMRGSGSADDMMGTERPQLTQYRTAAPELTTLQDMIDAGQWEEALPLAERLLEEWDRQEKTKSRGASTMEEAQYEQELQDAVNEELRRAYVYLLMQAGRTDEARQQAALLKKNEKKQ